MTRISRNFCVAVVIAGVLMATIESRAFAADLPDPQELVTKAHELEDLTVEGKPPLRLQAELHAIGLRPAWRKRPRAGVCAER
jgi:hypothetical protein